MHLSKLILNMCSPETRRLLLSPYLLHKAIYRAFPDVGDGGPGRILYRLDEYQKSVGDQTFLLVQSEKEPVWEKAELLIKCITGYENKPFNPEFSPGQLFYFRLRANPTVKKFMDNRPVRLGLVHESDQLDWLNRKAQVAGFAVIGCNVIPEGMTKDDKRDAAGKNLEMTLLSIRFEGKLRVIDPVLFNKAIQQGIGSAKGMGFGLLSIAPIRD